MTTPIRPTRSNPRTPNNAARVSAAQRAWDHSRSLIDTALGHNGSIASDLIRNETAEDIDNLATYLDNHLTACQENLGQSERFAFHFAVEQLKIISASLPRLRKSSTNA